MILEIFCKTDFNAVHHMTPCSVKFLDQPLHDEMGVGKNKESMVYIVRLFSENNPRQLSRLV
jgi:hypothetical protein